MLYFFQSVKGNDKWLIREHDYKQIKLPKSGKDDRRMENEALVLKGHDYGIPDAIGEVLSAWKSVPTGLECGMFRVISEKEQAENGKRCEGLWKKMRGHMKNFPHKIYAQKMWRDKTEGMLLEAMDKDVMFQLGELPSDIRTQLLESVREFIRYTREFDRELDMDCLGQALRNYFVYFMLCLSSGERNWFHEGIWGYSLLYPYTDNLVDGDKTAEEKMAFNSRLEQRLKGECVRPKDGLEEKVFSMLEAVEKVYSREHFKELYDFLLIIYDAQLGSLKQHGKAAKTEGELLRHSVYKGGASIYVDQCLIHGKLKQKEILFLTAFGFYLQLADDFQDIEEDKSNGHQTYMTLCADKGRLDEAVGRLLGFVAYIFENYWGGVTEMKKFMLDNCIQLITMTVFQNQQYFTESFVEQISEWAVLPAAFCAGMQRENQSFQKELQESLENPMEMLDVWCSL